VFDFALLSMLLAELRPATILEIGSGNGASALWLADLAAMNALVCRVLSVDVNSVPITHPAADFVTGDARDLTSVLPEGALARGPRLVLEDAHVGVREVMEYVHDRLAEGDYLVLEDSVGKVEHLEGFTTAHPDATPWTLVTPTISGSPGTDVDHPGDSRGVGAARWVRRRA